MSLLQLPPVDLPEEVSRPKGSTEFRDFAVARLAPYEGFWRRGKETVTLSKEVATEAVENIARYYNTTCYFEKHAPRSPAVIKKIAKLKKCADELAKQLGDMHPLMARVILGETLVRNNNSAYAKIFAAANVEEIMPAGDQPSAWFERINSFSNALDILSNDIPKNWERRGHAVKDSGSKRNHFIESEGTAKHIFLTDSLYIYDVFKPGCAKGTEENDLHQFVNEISEYATGKEPKNGLLRPLRDLIKPTREENEIDRRDNEILNELKAIAPGKTIEFMSEDELKKMDDLHAELSRNHKRRAKLSQITWPHWPLPA